MVKNYDDFVDRCDEDGLDMIDEMRNEIRKNIMDFNSNEQDINTSINNVMNLIYATRYEW